MTSRKNPPLLPTRKSQRVNARFMGNQYEERGNKSAAVRACSGKSWPDPPLTRSEADARGRQRFFLAEVDDAPPIQATNQVTAPPEATTTES